jgi:hypothetical protein
VAVIPSGSEPPGRTPRPSGDAGRVVPLRRLSDGTDGGVAQLAEAPGAVVAVAVALARYAVARAQLSRRMHLSGAAARRLRRAGTGPGVQAALASLVTSAGRRAVVTAGNVADVVLPGLARAVVSRIDLTALVQEFVDLDRVAAALDVDAVVAKVDLDAVVDRIDVDAIATGLDLDPLMAKVLATVDVTPVLDRLDLDAIVARVDLDRAVTRVDIERVLDRLDLDEIVQRVDLDRAVDSVDIDRVLARTDLIGLARWVVQEIDLPALIRYSTGSVTTEMVRSARDQSVDADRAVERLVDRLLRRSGRRTVQPLPEPTGTPSPEVPGDPG